MVTSVEQMLERFRQRQLSIDMFADQLVAICRDASLDPENMQSFLQQAIASGRLDEDSGNALYAALDSITTISNTGSASISVDLSNLKDGAISSVNPVTLFRSIEIAAVDKGRRQATPSVERLDLAQVQGGSTTIRAAFDPSIDGTSQAEIPLAHEIGSTGFESGQVIKDRFELKEQIGRGGMGIVFAAVDRRKVEVRDPNPMVAIKILNAEFARHPQALMALQREARKAQTLAHPNVATVFDFDREGDAVFMTMELLSGQPLENVISEHRGSGLKRVTALSIIKGIAEGLAYSHLKGLVHSDLKPANVFLTDEKVPKILDFGIARAMPSYLSRQAVMDEFDAGTLGAYTEAYSTIEMIEGVNPDPSDDVYALGLISYELLTGRHPYQSCSAAEAQQRKFVLEPIKGLSRREWNTIQRSLSFTREHRPKDAAAYLKGLTGITRIQKVLVAVSVILAVTALFFGYRSYLAIGPDIPFAQLPAATQQQFIIAMKEGDESWQFYAKDHNLLALQDSVTRYAEAYSLHPRNREATHALERSADAALQATQEHPEQQRDLAKMLAERSDFLADYQPIRKLLKGR